MDIGIVFAGGLARGSAQVGFVKGLLNHFSYDNIKIMSASSIGAINALGISANRFDSLEKLYLTNNFENKNILKLHIKNNFIKNIIFDITNNENNLKIPFYVSTTCYSSFTEQYFLLDSNSSIEDINDYINITTMNVFVNGLFKKYKGKIYSDGGTFDNVPTYPLTYHKLDLMLILHTTPNYIPPIELYDLDCAILDLDVTKKCNVKVNTFSFQSDNLKIMYDSGFIFGSEIGEKLKLGKSKESLKEICQEISREYIDKNDSLNSMTLVKLLNMIFNLKEVK